MRYILYELYAGTNDAFNNSLWGFYTDERERMTYEAQLARGEFEPVAMIDEKRISAVLKTPWAADGKNFSQRLWTSREQLIGTLQAELTRALITGADSKSVAKTIAQKMNAAEYAASRLVQTETTRIITESDKDTFAEMDIDEVEIVGTLDGHTCGTCGDMDGNHMPRSEAHAGTTAPPFHPNCRCVIVPYYGDEFRDEYRIMRDPETGKSKIVENMTFKEWKERYGSDGRLEDITKQYSQAPAQAGQIIKPEGYSESKHKEEIKVAGWLKEKVGGEIELLEESTERGVKTSDYKIDGRYWELKTVSSEKAADSAIRKGLKQIEENPGGIILQLRGENTFDVKHLAGNVSDRLRRSSSFDVTVLVVKDGEIVKAIKCEK